ncbi:RNA polymerase sigma factor [Methylorubrum suomiense]
MMDVGAHPIGSLYAAERGRLSQFVRRLLRGGAGAEDLVQQVFLRLLVSGCPGHGRATLMAAARNLALNHLRDLRRRGRRSCRTRPSPRSPTPPPRPKR